MNTSFRAYFAIILSLIFALCLSMLPVPQSIAWLRPNWAALVLIYWITFTPTRVGVYSGFSLGLVLDLLGGGFLGSKALTLSIVAFMTTLFRIRLQKMSLLNQLVTILILIGIEQLINLWIKLLFGEVPISFSYWLPTLISIAIWPLISVVLQSYQRTLKIN